MFIGRLAEQARIRGHLAATAAGSGTLVVTGAPGIGKTSLIDSMLGEVPADTVVVRARAVPSEVHLANAVLAELLEQVVDRIGSLPDPQRAAIDVVRGQRYGDPALAPLPTALGVLGAFTGQPGDPRTLVIVDDAQWLDGESRNTLMFVAHRALGRFTMIVVTRDDDRASDWGDEVIELGPLSPSDSEVLVRSVQPGIDPVPCAAIVAVSEGNPLALRTFGTGGDGLDAPTNAAVPGGLPTDLPKRLVARLTHRIAALPTSCQQALVIVAAAGDERFDVVRGALAAAGLDATSLEPGEEEGIVRIGAGSIGFTHPLVRTAVYSRASAPERRAAHAALASSTDGAVSVWHRAAAAAGPDDEIAAELQRIGREASVQGAWWTATEAFVRAVDLTPEQHDRLPGRLARAAEAAQFAGRTALAVELLARVRSADLTAGDRLRALTAAALAAAVGRVEIDLDEIEDGLTELGVLEPLRVAFALQWIAFRRAGGLDFARALRTLERSEETSGVRSSALRAFVAAMRGDRATARAELASPSPPGFEIYGDLMLRVVLEEMTLSPSTELGERDALLAVPAHAAAGWSAANRGDFIEARASYDEAHDLARFLGQGSSQQFAAAGRARVLGALGNFAQARADLDAVIGDPSRPLTTARYIGHAAAGFVELSAGRPDAALEPLMVAADLARRHGIGDPLVAPWAFDLVEVALLVGDRALARRTQGWLEQAADGTGSTAAAALAACGAAMLASGCDDDRFRSALALADVAHRRFDGARIRMLWGLRLQAARRPSDAAQPLRSAMEAFDDMGAGPWADRARRGLGNDAGPDASRVPVAGGVLSPRELEIARLVSTGRTVKEVAGEVYLSPKTVEWYISTVYRKLGVRSRLALAEVLRSAPDGPAREGISGE